MKSKILNMAAMAALGLGLASCSGLLEETPRATYTPEYFKSEEGAKGGITALYSDLRNTWGVGYWWSSLETGTDEYTYGASADDTNFKSLDMTPDVSTTTAENCPSKNLWNNAFKDINTASGVIQYGGEAGISASILAEAYFFRAFDYFELVQTFGGVPLDLGAGELKFNTSAVTGSKRNTVAEVYEKCIFPDFEEAVNNLPETSRLTGTVTKTTARLFLAKAYLTYAWWLENPNNIATYPTCERDASKAAGYFQKAYDTAIAALPDNLTGDNSAGYGLCDAYYDVFFGPNDRNKEILLYADHTAQDQYYNGGVAYTYGSDFAPDNSAHWMNRWNYQNFDGTMLQRTAYASYDRPWSRMATPVEVPTMFDNKDIDSRFETTFVTSFRVNYADAHTDNEGDTRADRLKKEFTNANGLKIKNGDIAIKFYGENDANVTYSSSNPCCFGTIPGDAAYIVTPDHLSRIAYLNVWKNGYYNETTYLDGTRGNFNGANPRPANIARFAELYFIAAEANVKGATAVANKSARDLLNVVRARAGKWRLEKFADKDIAKIPDGFIADNSTDMQNKTPSTITVDYILDERFREFYGEGLRWWDLVRTQTWNKKAATYKIAGNAFSDALDGQKQYTRTIPSNYWLRPIPLTQIDALDEDSKSGYQNPGY